jgi:quinol monooxygenase YgiN
MELVVFARFRAREGVDDAVAALMRNQLEPVRAEAGCLSIVAYRSTRDPRLFYLHSCWVDEAAFELHATLPHTLQFLERVQPLIDHSLDVTRTRLLG